MMHNPHYLKGAAKLAEVQGLSSVSRHFPEKQTMHSSADQIFPSREMRDCMSPLNFENADAKDIFTIGPWQMRRCVFIFKYI
jgi:hypothetical protein